MRLEGTQVNWESKDVNILNDEVFGAAGSFDPYVESWQRIAGGFAEIGRYVDASLRKASVAHEGAAADAARLVVDSLARYAVEAQQRALTVHAALNEQAGYRMDALTGLPEKMPPPAPAALLSPVGMPGGQDYARRAAEFDEQTQKARQVMRTYESNTNANLAALPRFELPAGAESSAIARGAGASAHHPASHQIAGQPTSGPDAPDAGSPAAGGPAVGGVHALGTVPSTAAVAPPPSSGWQPGPAAGPPVSADHPAANGPAASVPPGLGVPRAGVSGRGGESAPTRRARSSGQPPSSAPPPAARAGADSGPTAPQSATPAGFASSGQRTPVPGRTDGPPRPDGAPLPGRPVPAAGASDGRPGGPAVVTPQVPAGPRGPQVGGAKPSPRQPPSIPGRSAPGTTAGGQHFGDQQVGGPQAGSRQTGPGAPRPGAGAGPRHGGPRPVSGPPGGALPAAPPSGPIPLGDNRNRGQGPSSAGRPPMRTGGPMPLGPPSGPLRRPPMAPGAGRVPASGGPGPEPSAAGFGPTGGDFGPRGGGFGSAGADFGPNSPGDFGPAGAGFGPSGSGDFGPAGGDFGPAGGGFGPSGGDFGPSGGGFGPTGGGFGAGGGYVAPSRPAAEQPSAPANDPASMPETTARQEDGLRGRAKSYLVEADDGYGSGMMVAPPVLGE